MHVNYNIYNKSDVKVAVISEHDNELKLNVLAENEADLPLLLQQNEFNIRAFLESRVQPLDKVDVQKIIKDLNVNYVWHELIVRNSGRVMTDDFYVLKEVNGVETEKTNLSSINYIGEVEGCDVTIDFEKIPIFKVSKIDCMDTEASTGSYAKWKKAVTVKGKKRYIWIKASDMEFGCYGKESLMEVVVYLLAEALNIKGVLMYKPCILDITELNGDVIRTVGCYSFDFTLENEELVPLYSLLGKRQSTSADYRAVIEKMSNTTKISDAEIRNYIDKNILIDALVLNTDRHTGNFGAIKNRVTGQYRVAPVFDNGYALKGLCDGISKEFTDEDMIDYNVKPFDDFVDVEMTFTNYSKHDLVQMYININIDKLIEFINVYFEYFGYGYNESWSEEKRAKVDKLRSKYNVKTDYIDSNRTFLISAIKRRIDVVLGGQPIENEWYAEQINKRIGDLKYEGN